MLSTITTFSPPRTRPTARSSSDQADGHAIRLHQVADEDEERDRQQDEIVDAPRHLLREDDARQRAVGPDIDK
jgi:hypothetical protein